MTKQVEIGTDSYDEVGVVYSRTIGRITLTRLMVLEGPNTMVGREVVVVLSEAEARDMVDAITRILQPVEENSLLRNRGRRHTGWAAGANRK